MQVKNEKKLTKVTKILRVTKDGDLLIFNKNVVIPQVDVKVRHHLKISPEKQSAFWELDKQIEQKVNNYRKIITENRKLVRIDRRKIMTTIDNWFNYATIKAAN